MRRFLGALGALFLWAGAADAQMTPSSIPLSPVQIQAAINTSIAPAAPGGITAVVLNQILNQFDPFTNVWFDASNAQNGLLNTWNGSSWVPFAIPSANVTAAFASPPCLGCVAPGPAFVSTLNATGGVSGAGMDAYTAARLVAGLPAMVSTFSASGASSFAGPVSGAGMDTYTAARIAAGLPGVFGSLSASGTVSGAGLDAYTALRIGAGLPGVFSTLVGTASSNFADRARTFQSFGAVGDGIADDTANVQTALRSGVPISCRGKFLVTSLITVTNTNIYVEGNGDSCQFVLNNSQSMFSFSETGNALYTVNRVTLKGIRVQVNAVITNVVGPAHTAAFFISYPLGTPGSVSPIVVVDDLRISPTVSPNYIINGLYFNDVNDAQVTKYSYEGNRTIVDPNSNAVVWDGTHTPTTLTLENAFADFVGKGLFAPQVSSAGWQGIRVNKFDCVWCGTIVAAQGSLDGTSGYLDVTGVEGPSIFGISVLNVSRVFLHENYIFLVSTINGLTNSLTPVCYQVGWNMAVYYNSPSMVANNTCDGLQYSVGGMTRYGEIINGTSNTPIGVVLGPNTNSNLEVGQSIQANTAGVTVYQGTSKGVTTPFQNLGTPGGNIMVPPVAVTDGMPRPAGLVGEVVSSFVGFPSRVPLTTAVAKNVTQVTLTPGDWDCRGDLVFNPNAATSYTLIAGGVSTISNVLPTLGTNGSFFLPLAWTTGVSSETPIGSFQITANVSTPLYLVALSNFSTNSQEAYGNLECRRM